MTSQLLSANASGHTSEILGLSSFTGHHSTTLKPQFAWDSHRTGNSSAMTAVLFGGNRFVIVDSDGYFVFQTQKKTHIHPHRNTPWRVNEEGLVRETCYHTTKNPESTCLHGAFLAGDHTLKVDCLPTTTQESIGVYISDRTQNIWILEASPAFRDGSYWLGKTKAPGAHLRISQFGQTSGGVVVYAHVQSTHDGSCVAWPIAKDRNTPNTRSKGHPSHPSRLLS